MLCYLNSETIASILLNCEKPNCELYVLLHNYYILLYVGLIEDFKEKEENRNYQKDFETCFTTNC